MTSVGQPQWTDGRLARLDDSRVVQLSCATSTTWSRFEGIPPSSRRFALRRLHLARKDENRHARVERLADLGARGERLPGS